MLVALVIAATSLQPGTANVNDLSKQGDARVGLLALESSGIGPGALEPIEILALPGERARGARIRRLGAGSARRRRAGERAVAT